MDTVLIVGAGAREHAIAWHCSKQDSIKSIIVCPGNAGMETLPRTKTFPISVENIDAIVSLALEHTVTCAIIGPELPLSLGIADKLNQHGILTWGPNQYAAQLESKKIFSKAFMLKHGIPTATSAQFSDYIQAVNFLDNSNFPIVIKADGLAAGKGVFIVSSKQEATEVLHMLMVEKKLGLACAQVILEEYIDGFEVSAIAMVWDASYVMLEYSQDHKRLLDGNQGPNTGGMGAYSPVPAVTKNLETTIIETIIKPTINALQKDAISYRGFLYAGLMVRENRVYVLEYNCRLGDPEAQTLLLRLQSSLVSAIHSLSQGTTPELHWDKRCSVGVVLAQEGYPTSASGETTITLPNLHSKHTMIFQASTKLKSGTLHSSGGRTLTVTALGDTVLEAHREAYALVSAIEFKNCVFRKDIGKLQEQ
ncbi:MAG: phosphoribosylamine--glycine ligase [Methylacidiphilales bacterium]|nr:phosphoribosylamine--glycine ligase [Candidatus Methylacidiphilales bacterium]